MSEPLGTVPTKGFMKPQTRGSDKQDLRVLLFHWGLPRAQLVLPRQGVDKGGRGKKDKAFQGPSADQGKDQGHLGTGDQGRSWRGRHGGRCSQRPLPAPCGCRTPLQKRGPPVCENGVSRQASQPGSQPRFLCPLRSPCPPAASILPAWLWCSLRFPTAVVVQKPPSPAQARLVLRPTLHKCQQARNQLRSQDGHR